jgi:hypothetical protein
LRAQASWGGDQHVNMRTIMAVVAIRSVALLVRLEWLPSYVCSKDSLLSKTEVYHTTESNDASSEKKSQGSKLSFILTKSDIDRSRIIYKLPVR